MKHALWLASAIILVGCNASAPDSSDTSPSEASVEIIKPEPVASLAPADVALDFATDAQLSPELELDNVRRMFEVAEPSLANSDALSDLETARILRNTIYRMVPSQNSWSAIEWANYDRWAYESLFDDDKGHFALGMAGLYAVALTAFDIPNRAVSLFSGVDPYESGSNSNEVYVDGRWMAMDATFDAEFQNAAGQSLSWAEIRETCGDGDINHVYGMGSPLEGRSSIETSAFVICDMTQVIAYSPSNLTEFETLPNSWDGTISYSNGTDFSVGPQLSVGQPWVVSQSVE